MIEILDGDVWNIQYSEYDMLQIGKFFLDDHFTDKIVIWKDEKPIKVITSIDIANQRPVKEDTLIHNDSVFTQARQKFLAYGEDREGRCLPVINEAGELEYILTYSYNRDFSLDKWDYVREFEEFDLCSEELDLDLLKRADTYIIENFNEYTDTIIKIIKKYWKNKRILVTDHKVNYFRNDVECYNSIDDVYHKLSQNRIMFITGNCHERQRDLGSKKRQITKYLTLEYNDMEVMTSLFWKSNITTLGNLNPDKKILLIKYPIETDGLGCVISATTDIMKMAADKDLIPVVDLSIPEQCNQFTLGKPENMWEYYFKQMSDIGVEEAYHSQNVILWNNVFDKFNPYLQETVTFKKSYSIKECLCLSQKTYDYCEQQWNKIIPKGEKVLGVIARGTDYRTICNFQGNENIFVKKVLEKMYLWDCKYIFLATEDQTILEKFQQTELREHLLYQEQKRYNYQKSENQYCLLGNIKNRENEDGYLEGLKYFSVLYILSKCQSFITNVKCGAFWVVKGLTPAFEHEWIQDDDFRM